MLASFNPEQLALFHRLIPMIVDATLHRLLWSLEENDWLDVCVKMEDGTVVGTRDEFEGPGSLYNAEGWIRRYSRERHEDLV